MFSVYFIALFSLTAAAPLTPETVIEAVEEVTWETLCLCLCVSQSKYYEILANYPPKSHRRVLVDWWFFMDPAPSWRRLIHRLDEFNESETADKIRHNAEPVEGMLSTDMPVCSYMLPHSHSCLNCWQYNYTGRSALL